MTPVEARERIERAFASGDHAAVHRFLLLGDRLASLILRHLREGSGNLENSDLVLQLTELLGVEEDGEVSEANLAWILARTVAWQRDKIEELRALIREPKD